MGFIARVHKRVSCNKMSVSVSQCYKSIINGYMAISKSVNGKNFLLHYGIYGES